MKFIFIISIYHFVMHFSHIHASSGLTGATHFQLGFHQQQQSQVLGSHLLSMEFLRNCILTQLWNQIDIRQLLLTKHSKGQLTPPCQHTYNVQLKLVDKIGFNRMSYQCTDVPCTLSFVHIVCSSLLVYQSCVNT